MNNHSDILSFNSNNILRRQLNTMQDSHMINDIKMPAFDNLAIDSEKLQNSDNNTQLIQQNRESNAGLLLESSLVTHNNNDDDDDDNNKLSTLTSLNDSNDGLYSNQSHQNNHPSNFDVYIKKPMQITYKSLLSLILYIKNSKILTILILQGILFICNIMNLISRICMLCIMTCLCLIYAIRIIHRCYKKMYRTKRRANRSKPFFWNRQLHTIAHLYNTSTTQEERNQIINRIITHEIRLNQLRAQLEMNLRETGDPNILDESPISINQQSDQILDYVGFIRQYVEADESMQSDIAPTGLTKEQIENLPIEKFMLCDTTQNLEGDFGGCTICFEDFQEGDILRKFTCRHRFHMKCIDNWLIIKNICPNCKCIIDSTQLQ